jgi:hypothetical protein
VSIPSRFHPNAIAILKFRIPICETRDQSPLPLGFRTYLEQNLAERRIDRQFGADMIGERTTTLFFKRWGDFFVEDAVALIEQALELR